MSSVAYIKQKAIEIANNSSHKIIIGVMNQKYVDADCSSVLGKSESFGNFDESEFTFMDSYLSRRQDRLERRIKRKAERIARRFNY